MQIIKKNEILFYIGIFIPIALGCIALSLKYLGLGIYDDFIFYKLLNTSKSDLLKISIIIGVFSTVYGYIKIHKIKVFINEKYIFFKSLDFKFYQIFMFIILICSVFAVFLGNTYVIHGNLHDLWIPQLSAYALKNNMAIHDEFHTSFGYFYHVLNYTSLSLIENFPNIFYKSDLIFLSSLLFSGFVILVYILIYINVKHIHDNIKKIGLFIFLFVLSITFQVRNVSNVLDHNHILWYGSYNSHLWSLLFFQIFHVFSWLVVLKNRTNDIKLSHFLLFSFIQALLCFIMFNYKINFFVASCFVAGSLFFFLNNKRKLYYASIFSVLFILFNVLLSVSVEYSYIGYFHDVWHAILSRSNTNIGKIEYVFIYTIVLLGIIYYKAIFSAKNLNFLTKEQFQQTFKCIYLNIKNLIINWRNNDLIKNVIFVFSINLSAFIGIIGDWQKPKIFFLFPILIFLLIFKNKCKKVKFFAYFLFSLFIITNILSLNYITFKKFYYEKPFSKYKKISFFEKNTTDKKNDYLIKNFIGLENFYNVFNIKKMNADSMKILQEIAFSYAPYKTHWRLPFSNYGYNDMLNNALIRIKNIPNYNDDKIMMLEFVNPLPIILNTPLPNNTYHWVHLGTTFSPENIDDLYDTFRETDILYMPIITTDGIHQTYLNCVFFNWNLNNKRLKLFSIGEYGMLFLSQDKLAKYNLKTITVSNTIRNKTIKSCKKIKYLIYKKYLKRLPDE